MYRLISVVLCLAAGASAFAPAVRATPRTTARMAFPSPLDEFKEELAQTANTIASKGKGILACDEVRPHHFPVPTPSLRL